MPFMVVLSHPSGPTFIGCCGSTHTGVIGNANGRVTLLMGVVALPRMGALLSIVVPGP